MLILTATLILSFILIPQDSSPLFKSSYQNILNKAKAHYQSRFGKNKTWHFLGHDLSEYPGANSKYREINKQKWEEYYNCLRNQNISLGSYQSITPEAVQGFEGGSVKMECKICLSPNERDAVEFVEWYWAPLNVNHLTPIEYSENIILSPEDKTLTIYNLNELQTGQYICKAGASLTAPYFLTVVNSTINLTEVHFNLARQGPYPKEAEFIADHNLVIDTVWNDWSPCSTCGKAGKRYRFGYCLVILQEEEHSVDVLNFSNQKVQKRKALDKDMELLKIFKYRVPCQSHILPDSIKDLPSIKSRANYIMTGYCKVSCNENQIFEVRDKDNNVIERANNSAGIYSMLQGIPPVDPPVQRTLQYENADDDVVITCPGKLNSDTPIQWQVGSKKVMPKLLSQQSSGRIHVSLTEKIHIKKVKVSDSNAYTCWQNNELAGVVKLVVEKKIKMTFNHHIMLFGMVLILSVFLYVFTRAFF